MVIGWLIDKICDKLNAITAHNFENLTEHQEQEIIEEIKFPKEKINYGNRKI